METTYQLDQVQLAIQMPPRGKRRPGGLGNYWLRDYQYETWKSDFEDHFIVIPQIESQVGVDNAALLAAHPLVTALGLGPYDLSADMDCCWEPENKKYLSAIDWVKTAADGAGKKVWAGTDAPALRAKGFTFLWIGTTTSLLTTTIRNNIRDINDSVSSEQLTKKNDPPPA